MTPPDGDALIPGGINQTVHAVAGHAYGAVGADIHIFGDRTPVYLLFEHRAVSGQDPAWQRAQPSRMLDARAEVVTFTGRETEFRNLAEWCAGGPDRRARWLHGEGGRGKTRLANHLASRLPGSGWTVVDAVHGTDTHPPAAGSQDLRVPADGAVLLIVDYADRWPVTDLSWLLQNRLLHQNVRTRVLLIARSAHGWPALQDKLHNLRINIDTSDQELPPLPDTGGAREHTFAVARDCFARLYPTLTRPHDITTPEALGQQQFGLTLAVHMAALVAVDAAVSGRRVPTDMAGLTAYLLNREHENWQQMVENATAGGLAYCTPAEVMARAVFVATLAGPTTGQDGLRVLEILDLRPPAGITISDVLADHAQCYRPISPSDTDVLQPLQPDRLAEDFLALTLEGSPISGYPVDPWATSATRRLLAAHSGRATSAGNRRALTYLAAAADRWTHVGTRHLYPILEASPQVAKHAGNAALTAIAAIEGIPSRVLMAVQQTLPAGRRVDQDSGAAALVERLTRRIPLAADGEGIAERARQLQQHSLRLAAIGRLGEAEHYAMVAVQMWRMCREYGSGFQPYELSEALNVRAAALGGLGNWPMMLAATEEAATILEGLVPDNPVFYLSALAKVTTNQSIALGGLGRGDDSLAYARRALTMLHALVFDHGDRDCIPSLARAARNYAAKLAEAGRPGEGLPPLNLAISMLEDLVTVDRAAHIADLAASALGYAELAVDAGTPASGLGAGQRAVQLREEMAKADRDLHLHKLVDAVISYAIVLEMAGQADQAAFYTRRGVELGEELLARRPTGQQLAELAGQISRLAEWAVQAGRHADALEYSHRAVRFCRHLFSHRTHDQVTLASHLMIFARIRAQLHIDLDAAHHAVDHAARLLVEAAPDTSEQNRAHAAHILRRTFALLGRAGDADLPCHQLLDTAALDAQAEAREQERFERWAQANPNWKDKVADDLRHILGGAWQNWPESGDAPNRG